VKKWAASLATACMNNYFSVEWCCLFWFQAMSIIVFQDQAGHIHNRADHEAIMPPLSIDGQRIA
jgi:hypothetical protein